MINDFVVPNIRIRFDARFNERLARGWWIQDGAPGHRAPSVTERLQDLFGSDRSGSDREWSPRSPYLSPLDFFLWAYPTRCHLQMLPS